MKEKYRQKMQDIIESEEGIKFANENPAAATFMITYRPMLDKINWAYKGGNSSPHSKAREARFLAKQKKKKKRKK